MQIWFRTHAYHKCSWAIVWQYLRKAFVATGHQVYDDFNDLPEDYSDCVELWWGNPAQWAWSDKSVRYRVGMAVSEARSLVAEGRELAYNNLELCDLLLCPSMFSANAYMECPANLHICIVPLGVDVQEMQYIEREWARTLKFVVAGAAQYRKGTWLAIEAFLDAFKRRDKASLTVWSSVKTPELMRLQEEYGVHKKITFDTSDVVSVREVFDTHHVLVSPHLSEGFGLLVPEAMATGMPCIVSKCSSPREFFSVDYGWWINMSEIYAPVAGCLDNTGGAWRLPDVKSLAENMRTAYADRNSCKHKGAGGAEFVRTCLTWENTAANVVARITEVLNGETIRCHSRP